MIKNDQKSNMIKSLNDKAQFYLVIVYLKLVAVIFLCHYSHIDKTF